jgi:hypothetical protein
MYFRALKHFGLAERCRREFGIHFLSSRVRLCLTPAIRFQEATSPIRCQTAAKCCQFFRPFCAFWCIRVRFGNRAVDLLFMPFYGVF